MLSKSLLKRRELMMSMGAAGFLAVPLFRESFVEAQAAAFPQRFVVLFLAGGVHFPDIEGVPNTGYGGWNFDTVLSPLKAVQSESIQILGCHNQAGGNMAGKSAEPHGAAMRGLLTGDSSVSSAGKAEWASTNTIDQQIAAVIGKGTPFESLQFGISSRGAQIDQTTLIIKNASALPAVDQPSTMFSRLFSNFMAPTQPTMTATVPGTPAPAPGPGVDANARGRSILDVLKNEVSALKGVAGVNEQAKLDQHLESLRALEQQLGPVPGGGTGGGGGVGVPPQVVGVGCAAPTVGNETDIPTIAANQFDLLYQSLVCDLTRVGSMQTLCSAQSGIGFPYVAGVANDHHGLEHEFDPKINDVGLFFTKYFGDFLNRLKATPEGSGNMLDNTLVLLCSEFCNAADHMHDYVPLTTFGRAGGKVTPGRVINYPDVPHNLALRSILQVFGINSPIGDAGLNSGTVISLA
ncbi:MAG: DUF1552 domain-containing protein [Polyangiaceae bacterium]|nr:DUF1552 domain-containing protein [Polyangiaceae bacterium]